MVKFEGQIIEYIRENAMLHPGNAVVVGVSGGADSVQCHASADEYHVFHGVIADEE